MAEIPPPLASRHTATGVVILSALGALAAVATLVLPTDAGSAPAFLVMRQLVVALQAAVLAVAVVIVWRTLAKRSLPVAVGALAACAGLLLLAVCQVAWIVAPTDWGTPVVLTVIRVAFVVAAALVAFGFLVLGVALLRRGLWRGPTRATLLVAGIVTIAAIATAVLAPAVLAPAVVLVVYAAWSLVLLGLVPGLLAPREVANAGVPQGAALTPVA